MILGRLLADGGSGSEEPYDALIERLAALRPRLDKGRVLGAAASHSTVSQVASFDGSANKNAESVFEGQAPNPFENKADPMDALVTHIGALLHSYEKNIDGRLAGLRREGEEGRRAIEEVSVRAGDTAVRAGESADRASAAAERATAAVEQATATADRAITGLTSLEARLERVSDAAAQAGDGLTTLEGRLARALEVIADDLQGEKARRAKWESEVEARLQARLREAEGRAATDAQRAVKKGLDEIVRYIDEERQAVRLRNRIATDEGGPSGLIDQASRWQPRPGPNRLDCMPASGGRTGHTSMDGPPRSRVFTDPPHLGHGPPAPADDPSQWDRHTHRAPTDEAPGWGSPGGAPNRANVLREHTWPPPRDAPLNEQLAQRLTSDSAQLRRAQVWRTRAGRLSARAQRLPTATDAGDHRLSEFTLAGGDFSSEQRTSQARLRELEKRYWEEKCNNLNISYT